MARRIRWPLPLLLIGLLASPGCGGSSDETGGTGEPGEAGVTGEPGETGEAGEPEELSEEEAALAPPPRFSEPTPASHAVPDRELLSDWVVVQRMEAPRYNGLINCTDIDGDGKVEPIYAAFSDGARLHRWTGTDLELVWLSPSPNEVQGFSWGDMDGDGTLELALAERENLPNRIFTLKDGVPELIWTAEEPDDSKSVHWGDADGDGDLDLAVANVGDNRVYYNEGGKLVRSVVIPSDRETDAFAWVDFDGDGDLDLVEGNSGTTGSPDRLLRNENNQRFVVADETEEASGTNHVEPGDMDGDGFPEFALANANGGDYVVSVRGGKFTILWESPDPVHNTTTTRWTDADGDGDLDLVTSSSEGLALYSNEDGKTLTLTWLSGPIGLFQGLAVCDVDGDGHDEWLTANDAGSNAIFGRPEVTRSWARPLDTKRAPSLVDRYKLKGAADAPSGAGEEELPTGAPTPTFPCPPEMVGVVGDSYELGESDEKYLPEGEWRQLTIRRGKFEIGDYCVARLPFPGEDGAAWPADGLRRETVEVLAAKLKGTGRRFCRADELLLAAAGPFNWRAPYHPDDRDPSGIGETNPCGSDDSPARLGGREGCRSLWGVQDFQIRSSWAATPEDLRRKLAAQGVDLDGQEWDYLVYGSTAREQTWYPPTNFSVHSHAVEDAAFEDDGLRLCADPGPASPEEEAAWAALRGEFEAAKGSFTDWLEPLVAKAPE